MAEMKNKVPKGILGFPVTPYDDSGNLNEKVLSQNIDFLLNEGLSAIFVGCGAGEFHSLGKDDYTTMVEIAVSTVGGRVPVFTGVGGNITRAIELAEISADLGAEGYLILPPYLIEGEETGVLNYLKAIIKSTNLNAIIYQRDKSVLSVKAVQELVDLPQVVGLKDGKGDMELNIELTQTIGDRLEWLNGMPFAEVTMPAYLPLGFKTYSSAISNYIPHISRMFYEALLNHDEKLVSELYQNTILPINRVRKQRKGYAISLIKAGMEIMGTPVGNNVRPPLIPVEKEHFKQLELILNDTLKKYPNKINKEYQNKKV